MDSGKSKSISTHKYKQGSDRRFALFPPLCSSPPLPFTPPPLQHYNSDDTGLLILLDPTILRLEEVKDNSLLQLNDTEWRARIRPEHLELVRVVRTDDKEARGAARRANIKHELKMRNQEVEELKTQRAALMDQCEAVRVIHEHAHLSLLRCTGFVVVLIFACCVVVLIEWGCRSL